MKKNIFFLLFFSLFMASCEDDNTMGMYRCDEGYIKYQATIGNDFDSAFDSLLKVETYRPQEPYIVVAEPLDVVYSDDDRVFYWIAFKDTNDRTYLCSPSDVIDTKGCWYKILWAED